MNNTAQMNFDGIHKKNLFIINKEFDTTIETTNRTTYVSDAFGLGIDETKQFSIFKDFNIGIDEGDVIYILALYHKDLQ